MKDIIFLIVITLPIYALVLLGVCYVYSTIKVKKFEIMQKHELSQFTYNNIAEDLAIFNAFMSETIREFLFIYYNKKTIKDDDEPAILENVKTDIVNNISPVLLHRIGIVYDEDHIDTILVQKIRIELGKAIQKHNGYINGKVKINLD